MKQETMPFDKPILEVLRPIKNYKREKKGK